MRRILVAVRAFFGAIFKGETTDRIEAALTGQPLKQLTVEPPPPPQRNDALIFLGALQREARFLDFLKESLTGYSDAQVGAAVRDVHRDCAAVIDRMFAPEQLLEQEEGSQVDVPAGFDAGCYRLVGNVTGEPPFEGRLIHHGWRAGKCEIPEWSGSDDASRVIAPAEVELK